MSLKQYFVPEGEKVMHAKLVVEGKEFDIVIHDPKLQDHITKQMKPKKKTGYERVAKDETYYYVDCDGNVMDRVECNTSGDDGFYEAANYYSDSKVAENNARADTLMRQLRRFAVEHRRKSLSWEESHIDKCCFLYDHNIKKIRVSYWYTSQAFGVVWFDSKETCQLAIETFKDELIWYFTEYRDCVEE